jgi:hypothetical protein
MVSACAVAETTAKIPTALNVIKNLRNRDILSSLKLNLSHLSGCSARRQPLTHVC